MTEVSSSVIAQNPDHSVSLWITVASNDQGVDHLKNSLELITSENLKNDYVSSIINVIFCYSDD